MTGLAWGESGDSTPARGGVEVLDEYLVPVDPMDDLLCESCQ